METSYQLKSAFRKQAGPEAIYFDFPPGQTVRSLQNIQRETAVMDFLFLCSGPTRATEPKIIPTVDPKSVHDSGRRVRGGTPSGCRGSFRGLARTMLGNRTADEH